MQGMVWIEPDKHEYMLEGKAQNVEGVLQGVWGRPSVYGGSVCKGGLG